MLLPVADPPVRVDSVMNALAIATHCVREIIVTGLGAGPEQAGQGIFADLAAVLRARNGE